MFGNTKTDINKEHAKIIQQIEQGERLPPRHEPPHSIREPGMGFEVFVTPSHPIFFEDFRWFGTMINQHISEPWSVEELPDTLLKDFRSDSPGLGRVYRVHYNQCDMGTLECQPSGFGFLDAEAFKKEPEAIARMQFRYLRFVPWDDAMSFVRGVAVLMGRFEEYDAAWARANALATAALTGYLWETVRVPDVVMDFYQEIRGPYESVRSTTAHWEKNGIDPFEKWGGDRMDFRRR